MQFYSHLNNCSRKNTLGRILTAKIRAEFKLLVNMFYRINSIIGSTTISNDGATILKHLDIVYPAALAMCDIAKGQDAEIGDGTTSGILYHITIRI